MSVRWIGYAAATSRPSRSPKALWRGLKKPSNNVENGSSVLVKTSAEVLEFETLRQLVGRYISSPLGKRELEKVQPHTDRDRLVADLAETGEGIEYLRLAARPQTAGRGAAIRVDFGG